MTWNWLDVLLLIILAVTVILGAVKGLARQIIGIAAVVAGLILALRYYANAGDVFAFLSNPVLANLLGFFLIFAGVLGVGWIINRLVSKTVKGPLKSLNHLLGAGLGLIKGVLICGIVVFGMLVFPVNIQALKESRLAPISLKMTRAAYDIIPQDLKEKFILAYQEIIGSKGKNVRKI